MIFFYLEPEWKPCLWPDFWNVKTISEPANLLGNKEYVEKAFGVRLGCEYALVFAPE